MALQVLLVFLAMLLTTESEQTRERLCLCGDRVLRLSSVDDKKYSSVSCDKSCTGENSTDMLGSRRPIRTRREIEDEVCKIDRSYPNWVVKNLTVDFHDRGYGAGWYAEVSWSPFTEASQPWRGYCLLYVPGNTVEAYNYSFYPKNQTSVNITSSWDRKKIYLSVVALPMSRNFSANAKRISLLPYEHKEGPETTNYPVTRIHSKTTEVCKIDRSYPNWVVKNLTVDFHDRGYGAGWYAKVSWSPFTEASQPWRGYCLLNIPGNIAEAVPYKYSFYPKNQTSVNITSSWDRKKIWLSVVALPMSRNFSANADRIDLLLYEHKEVLNTAIYPELTIHSKTTDVPNKVATYVSIATGLLVGLALFIGLLLYFLRRTKDSIPLPSDFQYHAFIIYNNEDSLWMKNKLLPLLEEKHHLTCCVHYRDFVLGKPFWENMADSVNKSYKVIALFSSNFVKSNYCNYELQLAIHRLVQYRDNSLVIIRTDAVDCEKLPPQLKDKSFIDYNDLLERPHWKRKLLDFLGQPDDSGTHHETGERFCNNNNTDGVTSGNRARIGFSRLESTISTTSNDSEISFL